MRIITAALCAVVVLGALSAVAALTPEMEEQIKAAAMEPAKIQPLVKGVSIEKAVEILEAAVKAVGQLPLEPDAKKERVAQLFAEAQKAMGDDALLAISEVIKKVPPELLPAVAAPGATAIAPSALPIAQPLAPPVAPRYEGQ